MTATYYRLEPEVAGDWGKRTRVDDRRGPPPKILELEYEFNTWLGDGLL